MKYGEKQLALKLGMAAGFMEAGRTIDTAKKMAGVTLAAMKRYGLIYENMIPDPKGYTYASDGKPSSHNGHMLHTGAWIPTCGIRRPADAPMVSVGGKMVRSSNKLFKKIGRAVFFKERRDARKKLWRESCR